MHVFWFLVFCILKSEKATRQKDKKLPVYWVTLGQGFSASVLLTFGVLTSLLQAVLGTVGG